MLPPMAHRTTKRHRRTPSRLKVKSLGALAGGLGELAHVVRFFVGHDINEGPKNTKSNELTPRQLHRMAEHVANVTTGGVTVQRGAGIYTGRNSAGEAWIAPPCADPGGTSGDPG